MPETITVAELNSRVKELFARTPALNDIWVSGEISGLKKYDSGYYFVLKDANSEIRAVMFKNAIPRLGFVPTENMKVRAFGSIGMYVARGSYQFIVEAMEKSGIGDRYLAFEALKKRLGEEGLFDASHKRPLPQYPKTIGVVTSASGAVIHDIITTSESRYRADILLAPAMVQGEGAADSIVAGIELLNRQGVDVIIVGRGGGSIEDLWPFNEEKVARAIYSSKAPVVSAVGHETDFTISDFVADVRAPTPTGAAAIILRDSSEMLSELDSYMTRLNRAITAAIDGKRHSFEILDSKLSPEKAMDSLDMVSMHLDDLSSRADRSLSDVLTAMRMSFSALDSRLQPQRALEDMHGLEERVEVSLERIQTAARVMLEKQTGRLAAVSDRPEMAIDGILRDANGRLESDSKHLEGMNPTNVLTRGYSMITDMDGKVLTSVDGMDIGQSVTIRMRDGSAVADVTKKERQR